jgi:hypothetical protein
VTSFKQWLYEQEKSVTLYGLGKKGQSVGKSIVSVVKPAKPAKLVVPYSGINVPEVFAKRQPSGVLGK